MGRETIVSAISERLKKTGISHSLGNGSDMAINAQLLDAGWSTGSKKITYEALLLADETTETVFFWELTKEEGHGLSFGGGSGSYFQRGKTLYRKVKSVQYGFDGKAYEYEFNLGEIPKVVKEVAREYGWKFKTVLSKEKAQYPPGHSGGFVRIEETGLLQTPEPGLKSPALKEPVPKGKAKALKIIGVIFLAVMMLGILAILITPDRESSVNSNTPMNIQSKVKLTKVSETVIQPSNNITAVNYENYKIYIPAGTVQKDENLIISKAEGTPKVMKGLTELCPPFDVKLGDLREFKDPIIIEIPYDKSKLGGLQPEDAFIAVYYDENTGKWKDVPYQADTKTGTVRLQMYHLTTVSCYYSMWEGARVYDNGSALIIYNLDNEARKYYAQYEDATGKTAADPTIPQMVVDAADYAKKIIKAYIDAGLTMTGKTKIYLTSQNNYNSSSGNVCLKMDYSANERNPDKLMGRDLAHELFHKAQHNTLGWYAYSKTSYANVSFWMEATADYMGNKGAWLLLGEPPVDRYEEIPIIFFEKSLFTADPYEAANFVDFAISKHKVTPLELIQVAAESSVLSSLNFENRFNQFFGCEQYSNLLSYYDAFLEYTLFDNASHYALKSNKQMEAVFQKNTELKFEPNANNKAKNPILEGKGEIEVPGTYSAGFYRFTADMDATLEIISDSPLTMYSVNRTRGDRGFTKRVFVFSGTPSSLSFSKDDYVVITATASAKKTCGFKYKAVPLTVSAKEVSGLVPLKIKLPNGVTPGFAKGNQGMQVSISKWAEAEKYTLIFNNRGCFYEDANGDYEISNFNIINPTQFLLKGESNGSLQVEGQVDIEFRYWPKNGGGNSERKTYPIKATLTPNNEGYDLTLDINGMISAGKLK